MVTEIIPARSVSNGLVRPGKCVGGFRTGLTATATAGEKNFEYPRRLRVWAAVDYKFKTTVGEG